MNIILVNNTGANISEFDSVILDAVRNGGKLPEELADLFELNISTVDGKVRGILNAA